MAKPSQRNLEKRRKKWGIIIALVTAFILLSSMLAIVLNDNTGTSIRYRGVGFSQKQGFWTAKLDGKELYFYTSPDEFSAINISDSIAKRIIDSRMIYIVFDPNSELSFLGAIDQISSDLYTELAPDSIFVQRAVTNESTMYPLPIANCSNATSYLPMMLFQIANETSVAMDGNCIIAHAQTNRDVFLIKDDLQFLIFYGIEKQRP